MSDSARLVSRLHRLQPSLVRTNPLAPSIVGSTRSWASNLDTKLLLALDFHLASQASEVESQVKSSFVRPLIARSMCIQRLRWLSSREREPTLCPRWTQTFLRDLPAFFDSGPARRYFDACVRSRLEPSHPCRNGSAQFCRETYVDAFGSVRASE